MLSRQAVRAIISLTLACFLISCGVKAIVVEGEYPRPAVSPIAVHLGVYYSPELKAYNFTEYTDEGKEEYTISSGATHMQLFNSILPGLFTGVTLLESLDDAEAASVDAIFYPTIDEFQLALPQKTRLGAYEVWVKYNMRLLEPNGDYIADWILTAYGRTPSATLQTSESGINDATVGALRDLASNFSTGFSSVPEVKEWLENN
jgi:hypothetical protein